MKPIDEQNAVLLALRRAGEATPNTLTADLRAARIAVSFHQVTGALERLRRDGLVEIVGEQHFTGQVSSPTYSLTRAGRVAAGQLPEGVSNA